MYDSIALVKKMFSIVLKKMARTKTHDIPCFIEKDFEHFKTTINYLRNFILKNVVWMKSLYNKITTETKDIKLYSFKIKRQFKDDLLTIVLLYYLFISFTYLFTIIWVHIV